MMKKVFSTLFIAMLLAMVACGICSSANSINDETETITEISDAPGLEEPIAEDGLENEGGNENYSSVVYYVGDDIPVGGYVVNCTGTDYGLEVTVFSSEENYEDFQNEDKFTVDDYNSAVEQYAWADFYLYEGEDAYVGLQEGYIVLLEEGRCEFTKYDPAASQTIYPGIYVVGEDLNTEKINIKCCSEYMQVTQFGSRDNYSKYHKTDRFTNGEESDAIEQYAESTDFISMDESIYADLQDGMVVMVDEGIGEYSAAEGPVING